MLTNNNLLTLKRLSTQAREDFLKELIEGKNNYPLLAKKTGLDLQQLYRIVNGKSKPKLETLVDAYIKLLQKPVAD